jgi:hypothetical protein
LLSREQQSFDALREILEIVVISPGEQHQLARLESALISFADNWSGLCGLLRQLFVFHFMFKTRRSHKKKSKRPRIAENFWIAQEEALRLLLARGICVDKVSRACSRQDGTLILLLLRKRQHIPPRGDRKEFDPI